MFVIEVSPFICITVADQKFPLFVEVTHFQAQDKYLLQNMTDGVGGEVLKHFPQDTRALLLAWPRSRAAQLAAGWVLLA